MHCSSRQGLALGLVLVLGCAGENAPEPAAAVVTPDPACQGLYGAPNDNTGLDADTCRPMVGDWAPLAWSEADLTALRQWTLLDPPAVPEDDPFASPAPTPVAGAVCAVVVDDPSARTYRLQTVESVQAAGDAPITHGGACGLCSSLEDLAVYAGTPDLTAPVRQCGLQGAFGPIEDTVTCLEGLGFTPPCARIWAYNVRHTRQKCLEVCFDLLEAPYHTPDGALNACLQCDEDESGPVFKAVAGRTRRNSGLATALCRPCNSVWRIEHGAVTQ